MNTFSKYLLSAAAGLAALATHAQPLLPAQLQLRVTLRLADDLGITPNSTFNPRYFDGFAYANQISSHWSR